MDSLPLYSILTYFAHYFLTPKKRSVWLVFTFILFSKILGSQTLEFKNYTTEQGLITDEVYDLFQDRQGYLWVFSRYGTLKYNGYEFKPVLTNLALEDAFIYRMYEGSNGEKLAANSNARIYKIRNDSAFMIHGIEPVSTALRNSVSEIAKLAVDNSGSIYAITKGRCYKFIKNGDHYLPVILNENKRTGSFTIEVFEVDGELLHVMDFADKDAFKFARVAKRIHLQMTNTLLTLKPSELSFSFTRDFKRFNNAIYFLYGKNLAKIKNNEKTILYTGIPSEIMTYTHDKNNHIWVGCLHDGLYELNDQDSIVGHYLEHTTINNLLADKQGGLWASTPESGLYRCGNLKNLYFKNTGPLGTPLSFIRKIDNKLFIATKTGDIFRFENKKFTHLPATHKESPFQIVKQNENYFILYNLSIKKLNSGSDLTLASFISKTISQFNMFFLGNDTILCLWKRGVTYYIKGIAKKRVDFGIKILCSQLIGTTLWLGTENGVYCYQAGLINQAGRPGDLLTPEKYHLSPSSSLSQLQNVHVVKIVKDEAGNLWFCTQGKGLFKLTGKELINYSPDDALPGGFSNDLSFTSDGSVLLSTNKGLFIKKDNAGKPQKGKWKMIYTGNVQMAQEFETKIYAGVRNGLVIINNTEDRNNEANMFFNLASISIDSKEINAKHFKGLQSDQSNIEFKFDLITFSEAKPDIKYILHGAATDSGSVDNGSVKFNLLAPGAYTLTAFSLLDNKKKLKLSIPFFVEPSFRQTILFKVLFFILIILLAVSSSWLIISFNRKKQVAKTKNEQLLLEYKLIALKAQVNPHFISNCLSAIQHLIKSNETNKATTYIAKFGLLVRQILDFSSKQTITIDEELGLLNIYLELEQLRFENRFVYEIGIEEDVSLHETFLPPLLLNPIVENAIWHGLLPVQGQKKAELKIHVKRETTCLVISIHDNGVGRGYLKKDPDKHNGSSYGISITEQRLANLNYLYKRNEAKMIYTDLYDERSDPAGTLVTIYLPLILKSHTL